MSDAADQYAKTLRTAQAFLWGEGRLDRTIARRHFEDACRLAKALGLPQPCTRCYGRGRQFYQRLSKRGRRMRWLGPCKHCKGSKQEPLK